MMNKYNYILKVINKEIQFIIPIFLCILLFIIINIFSLLSIADISYGADLIIKEPYRILLYNFVHKNFNHLFSNVFGIIIIRYCFINLKLQNKFLFLYLIIFLIPIQVICLLIVDNFLFSNFNQLLIGFSGIIFGVYTFILLSSIYGKKYILNTFIGLKKNYEIKQLMIMVLSLGIMYSFLPEVSLSGHISGIFSGLILFCL